MRELKLDEQMRVSGGGTVSEVFYDQKGGANTISITSDNGSASFGAYGGGTGTATVSGTGATITVTTAGGEIATWTDPVDASYGTMEVDVSPSSSGGITMSGGLNLPGGDTMSLTPQVTMPDNTGPQENDY